MIMTNKITDEPGSGVKACKKGIKSALAMADSRT
ncbi:hypothetical protein LTSEMIN_1910, partial [Salmonella enterica subsp. enterica serovar Minnesota str. A4-603]